MSFSNDFKGHLTTASVSDIVSDRVYPVKMKDGAALPSVVYTIFEGQPQNSLDGYTSGRVFYRVQIDCWALLYRQIDQLGLAVRDRLNAPPAAFTCSILSYPLFDDYEEDTKRYRRTLEVLCGHRES